jgi:hypothetical protein
VRQGYKEDAGRIKRGCAAVEGVAQPTLPRGVLIFKMAPEGTEKAQRKRPEGPRKMKTLHNQGVREGQKGRGKLT